MMHQGVTRTWLASALALGLALAMHPSAGAQAPPTLTISTRARSIQPGELVVLDVVCACATSKATGTAKAFDSSVPLVPVAEAGGWSGLIGLDVETRPGSYPVSVAIDTPDGPLTGTYTLVVKAKQFRTRRLKVAPAFVTPSPEASARIAKEAARLAALWGKMTPRERVGPFQVPVSATPGSSFGARSIFNGQARNPHGGVDFGSPSGTPIAAPADAVVTLAADLYFTGNTVILDHGRGLYSVLAHLSRMSVADGDLVNAGDIVGAVGATGRVTGPHLHWGVRLNGARIDPLSLVEVLAR